MVERKRTANFCLLLILHYHEAGSTTHNKTDRQTDRQNTRMLKSHHSAACKTLQTNAVPEAKERKSCRKWRVQKRAHGHSYTYMWVILAPCLALLRQTTSRNPARHRPRCSTPALRPLRLALVGERERERERREEKPTPVSRFPHTRLIPRTQVPYHVPKATTGQAWTNQN
jgi:hypothetical protein